MSNIRASVVVPTCNRIEDLLRLMHNLPEQLEKPVELVIVDSSDVPLETDSRFGAARAFCQQAGIEVVYQQVTTKGSSYQRNVGTALVRGSVIHFLDDDVVLAPDYLQQLNTVFEGHPEFAGGMGTVTNPKTGWGFNRFLRVLFLMQREGASGQFTFSGMPTHAYGTKNFKQVRVLGGCCMCYRTHIAKQYPFDERLGVYAYMEDCDLSKRVSDRHTLFYAPQAVLNHLQSPANRDRVRKNRAIYIRNYSYLFFKNFYHENRLRIVGYGWTIIGLFVEAAIGRNKQALLGYIDGLRLYYGRRPSAL